MKRLALILLLCLSGQAFAGDTYYVKTAANGGSDAAAGTDWSTAWATISKVNSSISAGDTVRFGTGRWYQSQFTPPTGGDASNVTVYACSTYTTATQYLSEIYAGTLLDDSWTNSSGDIYWHSYTDWGPDPYRSYGLAVDDTFLLSDTVTTGTLEEGEMYEDVSNNRVYVWCNGGGSPAGREVILNKLTKAVVLYNSSGADYIEFFGLTLGYGSPSIVRYYAQTTHTLYHHCNLRRASGVRGNNIAAILSEAFGSDTDNSTWGSYVVAIACSLGGNMVGTDDGGPSGQDGAHVWATYNSVRNVADSCAFHNSGNGFYIKNHLTSDLTYGNTVKHSTFANLEQCGFLITAHTESDSCYGNIFKNCHDAISPQGSATLPYVGKTFICNNTLFNVTHFGYVMSDNTADTLGTDNEIKYNISYHMNEGEPQWGFGYELGASTAQNWDIDSNMYYLCDNYFRTGTGVGSCGSGDLFAPNWQGECGKDLHSLYNTTDPGFTDTASGDFSRSEASSECYWTTDVDTFSVWGAMQPSGGSPPEPPVGDSTRTRNRSVLGGGLIQ